MKLSAVRRLAYRSGRVLGDVQAVERSIETGSPGPLARRALRKLAYRGLGKALRKGGL